MDWTKSVGRGLHSQLVWACKLVARTGQNRGRLPVRSPASRRRSELLPSTFWQAAPPWRKGLVLPSAHARVANEGLGLQTTKNLLGTSELNWAAVTGAGASAVRLLGIPSVLQAASTLRRVWDYR